GAFVVFEFAGPLCPDTSREINLAACPRVSPWGTGILLRARTCFCLSLGISFLQWAEPSTSRRASGRWRTTKRSADATAAARLVARLNNNTELWRTEESRISHASRRLGSIEIHSP